MGEPIELVLRPGIDIEKTPLLNEGGFSDGNLIRFFQKMLQKLGGWTRISNSRVVGICRGLHSFVDLDDNPYIPIGTNERLQLWTSDGTIEDITPIRQTRNRANPFATTNGSAVVTVTDAAHGAAVGDWVYIATAANVGGLKLQGLYQVVTVPTVDTYTINAGTNATATVAAGGTTFSFTTTLGSPTVDFTLGTYVFATGEQILVYVSTAVGGLTLAGEYTLTSPTQFNAGSNATSGATVSENSGDVRLLYLIASSLDPANPYAYGSGAYGVGYYSYGQDFTLEFYLRCWSLTNWGEILIASPLNGPIYNWTPPVAYNNVATLVSNAPAYSTAVFVAMPQQQMISLGSETGGAQDPLLIRYSDVSDYSSAGAWTPSSTNQAGSFRLTSGSRIIGGLQGSSQAYIWTDVALWTMRYVQPPFVYGFNKVGDGCGLVAVNGACEVGEDKLIWCGHKAIYQYDGGKVTQVPCTVWDYFFDNVDMVYAKSICCAFNSDFDEWTLYFPILGSDGLNTRYIKLHVPTGTWDKGILTRTAMMDRSDAAPVLGVDGEDGYLQAHETSNDNDGATMDSWAETAWIKLGEGGTYLSMERLLPDFVLNTNGQVSITVYVQNFSATGNSGVRTYGPKIVTASTKYLIIRARGGLAKIRFDFSALGTFARLGKVRLVGGPAGGR